jgi:hypothetical protein
VNKIICTIPHNKFKSEDERERNILIVIASQPGSTKKSEKEVLEVSEEKTKTLDTTLIFFVWWRTKDDILLLSA